MTGARDWSPQGTATDTLSDRRIAAADGISIPEPRHGDEWEPRPSDWEPRPGDWEPGSAPDWRPRQADDWARDPAPEPDGHPAPSWEPHPLPDWEQPPARHWEPYPAGDWPGAAPPAGWFLPGISQPGISQPGISQPGITRPGPGQPNPSQPNPSQPSIGLSGVVRPAADQPSTSQPAPGQNSPGQNSAGLGGLATIAEPEALPDPIVFGPPASPWLRSHNVWAESGIEWQQFTPPADVTDRQADATEHRTDATEHRTDDTDYRLDHTNRQAVGPDYRLTATARRADVTDYRTEPQRPSSGRRTRPAGRHARPRPGRTLQTEHTAQAEHTEHTYANLLGAPVQISPEDLDVIPEPEPELTERDQTLLLEPDRPRMLFGHRVMAMGVPVIVLAMVGALAVALLTGHGPKLAQPAPAQDRAPAQGQAAALTPAAFPGYPGQQQRGVFESLNRIVVSGNTIVATGQQTGAGIARQQFFVSTNGGQSWRLAAETVAGGTGSPAPGHIAPLLAGGPGGWLAIGQHGIWTSHDGTAWTLAANHGITQVPGDAVWVLTRTGTGYLAGGTDAHGQGVVWTSPDGVHWKRTITVHLGIHAQNIAYATAHGHAIVIAGDTPHGGSGAWRSTDGGRTWTPVTIPASHGGSGKIAGVAWTGDGLLAVRDGAAGDAISYFSHNGLSWHYTGTIGAASGLRPHVVKGNGYGLVVAGQDRSGQLVAYLSADNGTTWRPTAILGNAAAESVVGAAVAPGDTAIALGATAANGVSQQGVFVKATPDGVRPLPLPGASIPELSVNATAQSGTGQAGTVQIAVGSADGYPAIWRRTGSTWSLVTRPGQFGAQLRANQNVAALTGVVHGSNGWLAVGANLILTSPDGVTWRAVGGTAALAAADLLAAAAGPAGYVVVGAEQTATGLAPAAVWFSANLSDWTVASGTGHSGQMLAVAATGGGFAAVGTANHQPAVWVSRDGKSWALTDLSPAGSVLRHVAALGSRIVVTGTNAAGAPLVLVSTDSGTTWQVAELPEASESTRVTALTANPEGFTAVGVTGRAGDQQIVEWTSPGGTVWTPALVGDAGGTRTITALTSTGSSVTGIGQIATERSGQTVRWTSR